MSLLETSLPLTVWLISPKDVFAGDLFAIDSLVDISPKMSLLKTSLPLTVWLISPKDVFAGDLFTIDSLVDISQRCLC